MTIIVSGRIWTLPGRRAAFLEGSMPAVEDARQAPGCIDFVVAADPLDEDRVNVFEEWESAVHLHTFRGEGPEDDLASLIVRAEVRERTIS